MAYKIVVDIVDPGDGEIKVTHTFGGTPRARRGPTARITSARSNTSPPPRKRAT